MMPNFFFQKDTSGGKSSMKQFGTTVNSVTRNTNGYRRFTNIIDLSATKRLNLYVIYVVKGTHRR